MTDSRKKMLNRIRAMLNGEGRTEEEMMTFLAKARELMATYEIDEGELAEFDSEKATTFKSAVQDPYNIKFNLGYAVGKFCRCEAWRDKGQRLFCGMESDVIFATWLLDTLQRFVMRELRAYQKKLIVEKGAYHSNNLTSTSFVVGCVGRIVEKLKLLTPKYETSAVVKAEMAKNGVVLRKATNNHGEISAASAFAGRKAGEAARFDRPVSSGGVKYLK